MLVNIAQIQLQAAYAAFTHGIVSKWNYDFCIMDFQAASTADLLQTLEATIQLKLLPALSSQPPPNGLLCEVFSLPPKLGGLGIIDPTPTASEQHHASVKVTAPLVEIVQQQSTVTQPDLFQGQIKTEVRAARTSNLKQQVEELLPILPSQLHAALCRTGPREGFFFVANIPAN